MKKRIRKKVRRLNGNEVQLVVDMQKKIDHYERIMVEFCRMIKRKEERVIFEGSHSDPWEGDVYKFILAKIKEENESKNKETE